jgi:hypothetical protein
LAIQQAETLVESNKWKKWNMEDVEENTVDIILASAKTSIHLIALDSTVDTNETQI